MNSPPQPDHWIGRLIGERQRYRLDARLGSGGMGDVFLAMDVLLGQQVALKLIRDTLVVSEDLRKRFEREVAVCAALKSDHIVEVSDCGVTSEGYPFYVMEYLRGQSLGRLLQQQQRLSVEQTVRIISQVCEGLQLAHEGVTLWRDSATASKQVKVIHRDLKPDNIFLVPTVSADLVKILDFGVAKIRNDSVSENTNLTGMFVGTFHYAAPEQLKVMSNLDARADIYSLGIILYEMLSGTDPFGLGLNKCSISGVSWALAHTSKLPLPLQAQPGCDQIPSAIEAVVMRCLQKAPDDRFASVSELKQALQTAVEVISNTTIAQIPLSKQSSENITINQPLESSRQEVLEATLIKHQPPLKQKVSNITSLPLTALEQELGDSSLPLEQDSLLEILKEIIGPIAPTLLQQVSVTSLGIKELLENLTLYLSASQRIEFERRTLLLKESTVQPQTSSPSSSSSISSINPSFVSQCERDLADVIGPIATFLVQNALRTHPQLSPAELVKILSSEISDSQKADDFCQRLLKFET